MRTRTLHSDSIVSEATWYDAVLATLPLPLVVDATADAFLPLPISPVVDASDLISTVVLAYRLFTATPKSAVSPTSGPSAPAEIDAPFNGITTRVCSNAGRNRRHGSI